jgi:hypothetical protein
MATMQLDRPSRNAGDRLTTRASDRGSALVMAVIVSVVVVSLAGVLLSFANHQSTASRNDTQRQQTIDVAMAGVAKTDSFLEKDAAYTGTAGLVTAPGGGAQYEVTVVTQSDPGGLHKLVTSVVYVPTKAAPKVTRTVQQQVVLDPEAGAVGGGFTYAVYSTGNVETQSPVACSATPGPCAGGIGGIFSSAEIKLLAAGKVYSGDMTTTGNITTGSNDTINGTLRSGGGVSINGTSSHVYGDVYAAGNIVPIDGVVHGKAHGGGSVYNYYPGCNSHPPSNGEVTAHVTGACIEKGAAPPAITAPVQPNPFFTWNTANYPGGVTGPMQGPAFITAVNKKDTKGVFWINGDNISFPTDGALWLTDDLTIYSAVSTLTLPPIVVNKAGHPVQLSLIVLNGIADRGSFTVPADVKVLIYGGTGNIAINSATSAVNRPLTGVVYNRAGSVTFGANSSLTFAPVNAVGFNFPAGSGGSSTPTTYTVRSLSTREINNVVP